eukprot:5436474-Lingulodinium_polyedra.AAC.1
MTTEMDRLEEPLKKARGYMLKAIDERMANLMNKVLDTFVTALSGETADTDHFEAQKDLCLAEFPNLEMSFENL